MLHSFGLSFKNKINPTSGFPLLDQKHQSHRSQRAAALWNNAFPSHPVWYQTNHSLFSQHWQSQHKPQIRCSQSSVVWPPLGQNLTAHRSAVTFHGSRVSEDPVVFSWRSCQLHRQEMCQSRGLMAKWKEWKDGVWRESEGIKDWGEYASGKVKEGEDTEKQGEIKKDRWMDGWMEKLLKYPAEKEETEERDNTKGTGKPGHNSGKLLCCAFP